LERRGNSAFEDGQYMRAVACYERAIELGDEPGRIAFNLGVAFFQLGKYRDAERFFRSAGESDGAAARRLRAVYNLGVCLMNVADGKDADRLAEAISCFARCVRDDSAAAELKADARTNLEIAKLLWRKVRSGQAPPPDGNSSDHNDERPPEGQPENNTDDAGGNRGSSDGAGGKRLVPAQSAPNGSQPIATNQGPPPGAGHAPPIPDSDQAKPLPPHEALELLRQAEERIVRERRAIQKAAAPGEGKSYPDW
jgi:tetratricopeptide (TPR) repeat protein